MRAPLLPLLVGACDGAVLTTDEPPVDIDTAADADTDSDTDTDTDADTDTDTDADAVVVTEDLPIGTLDTGHSATPVDTAGIEAPPVIPEADALVDCNGAGDFLSIQSAIDASVSGDHIAIAPCTYVENLDYRGKSLDLFGQTAIATDVVIDGNGDTVVRAMRGESVDTRLRWVTLTGGDGSALRDEGAAVAVDFATLTLEGVVITGNRLSEAVLSVYAGGLTITDSIVRDNAIESDGYVLIGTAAAIVVSNSTVDCGGGDAALWAHAPLQVLDSVVTCDGGTYAVLIDSGEVHVRRSSVIGGSDAALDAYDNPDEYNERAYIFNSVMAGGRSGAVLRYMRGVVENSVFLGDLAGLQLQDMRVDTEVHNSAFQGASCALATDAGYAFTYNAFVNAVDCGVEGDVGTVTAPLDLVAPPLDVTLLPASALIDAGDPGGSHDDRDGTRNDIGRWGGPLAVIP
jgi:hypothetical protein